MSFVVRKDPSHQFPYPESGLWKILADEFTEVSKWVDAVITSGPNPAAPEGVNGSRYGGRVCDVQGLGKTEEVLTAYDADSHTFSYSVAAANFPDFLTKLENTWSVEPVSQDRAKVKTSLVVDVSGDGSAGSPQVQFAEQIAGTVDTAGRQLKAYAEGR